MHDAPPLLKFLGWLTLILPFALALALGTLALLRRPLSEDGTARLVFATAVASLAALAATFAGMLLVGTRHMTLGSAEWVRLDDPHGQAHFRFAAKFVHDRLSIPMAALTHLLCAVVGAFAHRYLHREEGYQRFFLNFACFYAGMAASVAAGTIETMFFGWELVGLASALLVGFFRDRPAPARNAFRVWAVYRIADAALLVGAALLHHTAAEGDFDALTGFAGSEATAWPHGACPLPAGQAFLIGALLLLAAAGKSGLVPFTGWLPRAMEGPTPSSAIFYGALSVHLGAFLLLRVGALLSASPWLAGAAVVLGVTTAAVATLAARVQTDIKSALAFASAAQVGLIVAEIGLGFRYLALVHLLGHACVRALQLLRAPNVLHDRHQLENATGGHAAHAAPDAAPARYRFGFERGYLDALLDRWIVAPFRKLFEGFERAESALAARLGGAPAEDSTRL